MHNSIMLEPPQTPIIIYDIPIADYNLLEAVLFEATHV